MSIVHRKLKPVDQNVGDQQAHHVFRTPETETISTGYGGIEAFHVYRTAETETSRSKCRRSALHVFCTPETETIITDQTLRVYRTPETESSTVEETRRVVSIIHWKLKSVKQDIEETSARNYRPSFCENKPKTLVLND
jgi:hypothetical protein